MVTVEQITAKQTELKNVEEQARKVVSQLQNMPKFGTSKIRLMLIKASAPLVAKTNALKSEIASLQAQKSAQDKKSEEVRKQQEELLNIPEVKKALVDKGLAEGDADTKRLGGKSRAFAIIGGVVAVGGLGYLIYWLVKK